MNKTTSVPRKPGDWDCPNAACAEINFGSRVACRKCAVPRPQAAATNATTNAMSVPRKPGDWDCPNAACAEVNFGSRTACRKCATPRPEGLGFNATNGGGRGRGRGGGGMAVALHTGNGTHVTMVYLQSLETKAASLASPGSDSRDARRLVKEAATAEAQRWAQDYWTTTVAEQDDDEEGGVSTTTPGLVRLEVGTHVGRQQHPRHWSPRWGTTAHINLKGSPASILNSHVDLFNGWVLL
ncbi:Znfinger in Ran binding protein and others domain containing protein [Acanthamoeba castellanii str. Neff]|uniref:Znfinger in Ran binding protein and others domain containing protein n=1 Tax=Acanthamoeba castellanii (strain ATCC 30010 / Neff) TaxID=1257118 RepID=L8GI95_ACACF|nr:Znfinger in Ran binding protein and others domain containing protein [Acanthamoeba castellanii str. Neff]ELR11906.1 Znfinger in Ran binding protein and others domain containing protein [Acanthamoeba castellanii str. Neff]